MQPEIILTTLEAGIKFFIPAAIMREKSLIENEQRILVSGSRYFFIVNHQSGFQLSESHNFSILLRYGLHKCMLTIVIQNEQTIISNRNAVFNVW